MATRMARLLRPLLLATALLTSGLVQLATAAGPDACCADEPAGQDAHDAPCPDCPGLACGCCPARGAVQPLAVDLAPAATRGVSVATAAAEPTPGAMPAGIFIPPRA